MFAAVVMPLLLRATVASAPPDWHRASIVLGYAFALLIAVSRVKVGAHSWSEVAAGLPSARRRAASLDPVACRRPMPRLLIVGVAVWLVSMPAGALPSPTHGWVTQLALAMSGRGVPTRARTCTGASSRPRVRATPGANADSVGGSMPSKRSSCTRATNRHTSIIVLHGLGADGNDFVPIAEQLDLDAVGAVRFVFPHAPVRP
jgi:hypothetical protein